MKPFEDLDAETRERLWAEARRMCDTDDGILATSLPSEQYHSCVKEGCIMVMPHNCHWLQKARKRARV